jgi:membrane-associated protease RseP (regulator of RpoE activity)
MHVLKLTLLVATSWLVVDAFQPPVSITTRVRTSSYPLSTATTTAPVVQHKTTTTQLEALNPLIASVASPVGAVAVLAGVILIHESGHYLAARVFGIEVEEFSIGVGPKVLGFQAFGNDFNLRAFPLGGYVRFPENYNATLAEAVETANALRESKTESTFQRNLNNVLYLGDYDKMLAEEEQRIETELKAAQQPWWKSFSGTKKAAAAPTEIEYYDNPDLLQNRPWPERAVVIAGGVIFNLILAFFIYFVQITGDGLPKPIFEPGAMVNAMPSEGAAVGLLNKGDVILRINGAPLSMDKSPTAAASQKAINDFIAKIQATPEGDSLQLSVLKQGGKNVEFAIQPKSNGKVQAIGVLLGPNFSRMDKIRSDSPGEATQLAATAVKDLTQETAKGLTKFFNGQAAAAGAKLSGPVGLIQTGSQIVSTSDLTTILTFAAAISVNLAVVNALPIPALDGGQMVFILLEALTKRKIDQRVQENITGVAVLLLLFVSLSTTVGDVESLFSK